MGMTNGKIGLACVYLLMCLHQVGVAKKHPAELFLQGIHSNCSQSLLATGSVLMSHNFPFNQLMSSVLLKRPPNSQMLPLLD